MRKDKAMKWVKALRSGKYKQGQNYLQEGDMFCCLGVACEVFKVPSIKRYGRIRYGTVDLSSEQFLSLKAQEKIGLSTEDGAFEPLAVKWPRSMPKGLRCKSSLAALNDAGATFKQIASFIELNYKHL